MNESDRPIIDELVSQARGFDPEPPAHFNRRIRSAVAAVEWPLAGGAARWFRRPVVAAVLAGVLLAAGLIYRQGRPARDVARGTGTTTTPTREVVVNRGAGSTSFGSANLVALAERWVDQPLQGEVDNLLNDLARTKDTVARVLPAATKRARPTTVKGTQGV